MIEFKSSAFCSVSLLKVSGGTPEHRTWPKLNLRLDSNADSQISQSMTMTTEAMEKPREKREELAVETGPATDETTNAMVSVNYSLRGTTRRQF